MHIFYALSPRQNAATRDDNESEITLGVIWDKRESRGVKSAHLGHTRYPVSYTHLRAHET